MHIDLTPIAERALDWIAPGAVVGLGTGRAAGAFLSMLAAKISAGLYVRGVPTSEATANLARELGIPLVEFDAVEGIDVTVDGADEVDPELNLIKGLGGALLREKVVAAASKKLLILVQAEKCVDVLGARGILPVEVVRFAAQFSRRRLAELGLEGEIRLVADKPLVTDNGNLIVDCRVRPGTNLAALEPAIRRIPGVIDTGLFLGMADTVLVQHGSRVEVRSHSGLATRPTA